MVGELQAYGEYADQPVVSANLADPRLEDVLERQLSVAGVCGVRDLRYDNYLQDPSWRRGFAQLASHKLVLRDDPALDQMADAARLADSCPEVTYCIDHAGFPHTSARRGILRPAARAMTRLAKVQNTIVKASGLRHERRPVVCQLNAELDTSGVRRESSLVQIGLGIGCIGLPVRG